MKYLVILIAASSAQLGSAWLDSAQYSHRINISLKVKKIALLFKYF